MADNNQSLWDLLGRGKVSDVLYPGPMDLAAANVGSHYNPNVQDGMSPWTSGYQPWVDTGVQDGMHAAPNLQNTAYDLWVAKQYGSGTHDLDPSVSGLLDQANEERLPVWISQQSPELQKILRSPIANKSYYQKVGVDRDAASQALLSQLGALQQAGLNYGNKAGSAEEQMGYLSNDLARYGVSDLNDLKSYQVKSPTTGKMIDIFYNNKTGAIVPTDFGSSMHGEGGNYYSLKNVNGHAIPVNSWADTSEAGDILPALAILAMPLTMGLTSALAPAVGAATGLGSAGATALTGAGIQGLTSGALSSAAGGDFGKGFATGAIGSGIGSGITALNPAGLAGIKNATLANAVNKGISGGLSGLTGAAINGGDVGKGALAGLTSGAISGAVSPAIKDLLGGDKGAGMIGNFLGSQAGKYASNSLVGSKSPTTVVKQGAQPVSTTSTPASGLRQLDLSRLPPQAQERIRSAYGTLSGLGANLGVKV